MSYCHKCGTKAKFEDSFCEKCGTKIGEFVKEVKQEARQVVHTVERQGRKFPLGLIIILLILSYIALDVWAATQLTPIFSLDSLATSISNFDLDVGYTSTTAATTIRLKNPTFVPVIAGRVIYDAGYGSTKVVEGKTGLIVVGPYSEKDVPADARLSYAGTAVSAGKALINAFTGKKESWNANAYIDFWVTKFKIGGAG